MSTMRGNSRLLFLALIAAVIVCAVFFIILFNTDKTDLDTVPDQATTTETGDEDADQIEWVTYTNEEYGFVIEHPNNWEVSAYPDDPDSPKFNFYPEGTDTSGLPFTHHSENVTHVSVFPHGIPTEGFLGETAETEVDFDVTVAGERDYTLTDGTHFATIAFMPEGGPGWTESGFIFAHVAVENGDTTCVPIDETLPCDPLSNGTIVRSGEIDEEARAVTVRILESFEFTE